VIAFDVRVGHALAQGVARWFRELSSRRFARDWEFPDRMALALPRFASIRNRLRGFYDRA